MSVAVIIAAGGRGLRLGASVPKQLLAVGGMSLLARSVWAFAREARVTEIVVVAPADHMGEVTGTLSAVAGHHVVVVTGGDTRQQSVANGLRATSSAAELVLVHDAARPFVSGDLIARTIDAARVHGAAIAAVRATDTVKRACLTADGVFIESTIPREDVFLAQTPQGFKRSVLEAAVRLGELGANVTDEAGLVELTGHPVMLVEGERTNLKVTTPEDLRLAEMLWGGVTGASDAVDRRPEVGDTVRMIRVGSGYDSHRLVVGRPLVLAGVVVPYEKGLAGHSDADVVAHAVTDAVLGAAALGDIGRWFPDTDPAWKDADSVGLLAAVTGRLAEHGFVVGNVDVTVIAERPKLAPYSRDMRNNLARALGVSEGDVSVKAKTNEGLDATGQGEAIVAHAVATVVRR